MSDRKHWTAEEVLQVAVEEGIDSQGATLAGVATGPDGLSRQEVISLLRMLAAIPDDRPGTGDRGYE